MKRQILVCVSLLFVLVASAGAEDFDSQKLISSEKLIEAQTIVNRFEAGQDRVKVIISLTEPIQMRAKTDWRLPESVSAMRAEIANRQSSVLSSLTGAEFRLRYRYENQAGFSGEVTAEGLNKLLDNPSVVFVEPVRIMHPLLAQGIPLMNATTDRLTYNGEDMAIAICDTGVDYTHPQLGDGGFPNDKVIGGYDFGDDDADPIPNGDAAHGTACAGIAAGDLGTVGDYIGGVAYNAKIYALKISYGSSDSATTDAMVAAWDWCVTHKNDDPDNPIMVTSTSFGGGQYFSPEQGDSASPAMTAAANNANAVGITVLAASGNEYYTDSLAWPAAISSVISVGAVDDVQDTVIGYSNTADFLDILAPSDWAYTLDIAGPNGYDAGDYYPYFNGTSAACPYAAGAVACLQSAALDLTGSYFTPVEVRDFLTAYGDPITDTKVDITKPRVNLGRAIDNIADIAAPAPDPAEWEIAPQATGTHTIAMEASEATDQSGVEYYFECVNDVNFDSGWQSGTYYEVSDPDPNSGIEPNTWYAFRVRARDLSENYNVTGWSDPCYTQTSGPNDTLPPFPDPSQWKIKPKVVRLQSTPLVRMSAVTSTDENGPIEYYFTCTFIDPPGPPPSNFNSGWISSSIYTISSGLTVGSTYTFTVKAKDALLNETTESIQASVTVGGQGANILTVPEPYPTIQSAIDAASNGEIVVVRPGTYTGTGNRDLDFSLGNGQMAITVRSIDPNDPSVVAATIIDCQGDIFDSHRAFDFHSGEGSNSIVAGFTITNGWIQGAPGMINPMPGGSGIPGGNAFGGAINCVGSGPTIRNCVITDCTAAGGPGGWGTDGDPCVPNGGNGAVGGSAFGGGVYCDTASNPIINDCEIRGCVAIGGISGYGGDGDDTTSGNGGAGANGSSAFGGGICCDAGSNAIITNSRIISYNGVIAWAGAPGGQGGAGPPGGLPGANGINGQAQGGGAYYGTGSVGNMSNTDVSVNEALITDWNWDFVNPEFWTVPGSQGGGIYCDATSTVTLTGCYISNNEAIEGDGGGIWYDHGGMLALNSCAVSNNTASGNGDGGGIYGGNLAAPLGATVIIDSNSTISGNTAGYGGGGLFLIETNLTVNDSTIRDNDAVEGAGIWAYNCVANVNDCTVRGNSATELGGGSAFINGLATINSSVMTGNSASGSVEGTGGALFFEGWSNNPHQVTNCLITDNIAYSDGGGLSNNIGAWVQITNCTFVDNEVTSSSGVGGGISCAEYWAWVEIFNSILWGNEATAGGSQIAVGDPHGSPPYGDGPYADVDVSYSDVQGGEEGVWLEDETQTYTAVWWLGGNIDEDPLFATTKTAEQTYFLSQVVSGQLEDSNCVDAGNGNASDLELTVGMSLTTRTDLVADSATNNVVDMGYHYEAGLGVPQYQLTIEVIDQGYGTFGTVLPPWGPGTYDVNQGKVVELYAEPNAGWEVYQWTGTDYVPTYLPDPNYNTVTMNSDKTVTVEFGPEGMYKLVTYVIGNGTIEPAGLTIWAPNTVVPLIATPNNPSEVIIWTGTDDDFSISRFNNVTMNAHKEVTVEFYAPRILYVPGDYPTIQAAIDDADDGDIIEISAADEPYYTQLGFEIDGKILTITSANPDDPYCVANTIIESDACAPATGVGPIFFFNNVGRNTVLNGLTISGYNAYGGYGGNGDDCDEFGADPGGDGGWISGGGISCGYVYEGLSGNASPTIKNCIITDCSILGGDGGIGVDGCADSPIGGEGGWPGRAYGAAMACFYGSSPLIINCTFQNNISTGGNGGDGGNGNDAPDWGPGGPGGGWYYGEGSRWYNWPWPYGPYDLYTEYTGRGGAVYVGPGCSPEFIDCTFTNNQAYGGTNGICGLDGAPVSARYEPSIHYRIDNFGGAVYVSGYSTARFVGCAFNDNLADTNNLPESSDLFVSYGGAVAFEDGADVTFEGCTFNGNLATIGGGMYWSWSDPLIDDCNFVGNSALHGGGVLFVGGTANIAGSNFSENEAIGAIGRGGAIACLGANAEIVDCNITNSDANGSGGGIYISNKDIGGEEVSGENTVLVKNCLITNNLANRDGGGISANWHSDPNIVNCTIADNMVTGAGFEAGYGGGLCCSYGNYTNIINSIIRGNSGQYGPQLAIGTGFEYDPLPSTVDVSYSDVQGAQSYVFIGEDCTLNWGAGNIHTDPLFVTGPLGNYYLSQIAAGQSVDSDCVDTGSNSAENLGMDRYTTRTDEKPDRRTVDMGYHYPFTPEAEPCRFCELFRDGIINFKDFAVFTLNWLSEDCSPANEWCWHADVTFDTYVNFEDVKLFAECWLVEDTYPPAPNPSEWLIDPYPSWSPEHPNSISMTARTASDAWDFWVGNVQYYFDCVYGDCNDSGWQNDSNYTDSDLVVGVEYGYRVRARDASRRIPDDGTGEPGNKTEWSLTRYAIAGEEPPPPEDHNPPTPNPMTWATEPDATSPTSIAMVATTATDDTADVEYYFEDFDFPAVNSGWQSSPMWEDTTCEPETTYTYRVMARDTSPWWNETGWSDPCSATTPEEAPPPDTNPPVPVAWEVAPYETGSGMDAFANMTAAEATDPEGNGPVLYYFECVGIPSINSGWMTERVWNSVPIGRENQFLYFHFRVSDNLGNMSGWSTSLPCY